MQRNGSVAAAAMPAQTPPLSSANRGSAPRVLSPGFATRRLASPARVPSPGRPQAQARAESPGFYQKAQVRDSSPGMLWRGGSARETPAARRQNIGSAREVEGPVITPSMPPRAAREGAAHVLPSPGTRSQVLLQPAEPSLSLEDRFHRIENAQDKLVQATVDAVHQQQTLLRAAEERWEQRVEALEESLGQQRLIQYSTTQDVCALKVALTVSEPGNPTPYLSRTENPLSSEASDQLACLLSQTDHLRLAFADLVDQMEADRGRTKQFSTDVNEVRGMLADTVKVNEAFAAESKRLRHQLTQDFVDTNTRLEDIERLMGQLPKTSVQARRFEREADDLKVDDEMLSILSQAKLKELRHAASAECPPSTSDRPRPKLDDFRSMDSALNEDNLEAVLSSVDAVVSEEARGDVGDVIKRLRARLRSAPTTADSGEVAVSTTSSSAAKLKSRGREAPASNLLHFQQLGSN